MGHRNLTLLHRFSTYKRHQEHFGRHNELISQKVQDHQKNLGTEPNQKPLINKIEELIDQQKKDKFCANILCQLEKG